VAIPEKYLRDLTSTGYKNIYFFTAVQEFEKSVFATFKNKKSYHRLKKDYQNHAEYLDELKHNNFSSSREM